MNIFHKIALEGLKKNRTRTLVTIVGVILSSAMFTAVAGFGTSLLNYMINGSIAKCGGWHVAFPDVDSSFVQERAQEREVSDVISYENTGYAELDGIKSPDKPYLFIAGFNSETFEALPITLISGRLPENSGEILVPSHLKMKGGIRLTTGDTLTLTAGIREADGEVLNQHDPYRSGQETLVSAAEKTFTVVGICERPGFEEHSSPGYTLITRADPAAPAESHSVFVTLKNPRKARDYAGRIAGSFVLNEDVLRYMGVSDNRLFNTVLYSIGGILVAIIMTGSIFLIYNSFNISLNERTHQFGILMSAGATEKQLRNSVLFEGLCIGAIGIPCGILSGIGIIVLVLPVVSRNFGTITSSGIPLTLKLSALSFIASAAVSLVTILISAYLPARKAAHVPVIECIRQTNEIKTEAGKVKTSRRALRLYGLEGTLALKNFKRNKKRYRSVILSLTLSVVLFVSGSAFGLSLKYLAKMNTVEMDGDIIFSIQDMEETELLQLFDSLKTADGVYKTTYQAALSCSCLTDDIPADFMETYRKAMGDKSTDRTLKLPLEVVFYEDSIYYGYLESLGLPKTEYSGQDAKFLTLGINTADKKTYFTDSTISYSLVSASGEPAGTISATFVDSFPLDPVRKDLSEGLPEYHFMLLAPWQTKSLFDATDAPELYGITFWSENPALSMAQIQSMIEDAGITAEYTLFNLSTTVDLFRSGTFVINVFTYFFVIMISLIAVANVFNTISTNIRLRRRELAMLRSVGMSERSFYKMMNFECIFYGLRTLLISVPIAGILSWLINKGLMAVERVDEFNFIFPWESMAVSVIGVFCIVFITMLYATDKIKKENIIDALRDDMA